MNANPQTANLGKILVIDDEEAILITLKKILRTAGYEAQTAQTGREGLDLFGQGAWDVVIVDRKMPGMNGEEVAAEMKRLAPAVPIILITGFPGAVTRHDLFHAILGKPFRPPEFLQCLADARRRGSDDRGTASEALPEMSEPAPSGGGAFSLRNSAPEALSSWKILVAKPCLGSA